MSLFQDPKYESLFASISAMKVRRDEFVEEAQSGSLSLGELFERAWSEPVLASMKVLPAVEALPETGKVSTRRAFGDLGISEAGLISDVSAEQVEALPAAIKSHAR